MSSPSLLPRDLAGWLNYIEALHPKSIAMGLDRVNAVKLRLNLRADFPLIMVAGTNGKGSTCAILERIYHEAGYRVACYTSPHLLRYNERVRVACQSAEDAALVQAFIAVEHARANTPLTYFEFATLAAMWHFTHANVALAILEVGLGGRLDAVNAFTPDCTIVSSIDLDHMDLLGDSRESIGHEKAGIFRGGVAAICGDPSPPLSLMHHADQIGAQFQQIQKHFHAERVAQAAIWSFRHGTMFLSDLPLPALVGDFQLQNAACALAAIHDLQPRLAVTVSQMVAGLTRVKLAGRFQQVADCPQIILDVAHNPHAAQALAQNLAHQPCGGKTRAVFSMLADKDIAGVVQILQKFIDYWYVAKISHPRGAGIEQQVAIIAEQASGAVVSFSDLATAFRQACLDANDNDRIIVFGSFFTVSDVMRALPQIQLDNKDS